MTWSASASNWTGSAATASPGRIPPRPGPRSSGPSSARPWTSYLAPAAWRASFAAASLAGPSLPLDIGYSETIPPGIRNAVILRDRHCRFPGCHQPASVCQVHHVKHKKNGGETSAADCVLLCRFQHLIVIHRWDWSLVLNRDGTTTAWNKDRTKVLHSHGPPDRPG